MSKIRFAPAILVTFALAFVATDAAVAGPGGGGGTGDGIGITRGVGGALLNVVDPLREEDPVNLLFTLFGAESDTLVVGDWNGDGNPTFGLAREENGALLWILDFAGTGSLDFQLFGSAGDRPVVGDFDPNSAGDEIGFVRPTVDGTLEWILRDNTPGEGFSRTLFGTETDIPVPGNWDGDPGNGDELGVVRDEPGLGARLWITQGSGGLDFNFFGAAGDEPIAGDWSGDGNTQRGVRQTSGGASVFILDGDVLEFVLLGTETDGIFNSRSIGQTP